jgi:hypothetical protein
MQLMFSWQITWRISDIDLPIFPVHLREPLSAALPAQPLHQPQGRQPLWPPRHGLLLKVCAAKTQLRELVNIDASR